MPIVLTPEQRRDYIERIRRFPAELEAAIAGLSDEQLLARPIPGEWSIAQNVHHLVDSHVNAYCRLRLLLTEENPTLRGYDQDKWAELPDAVTSDLSDSLTILRGLHARWAALWDTLTDADFARQGFHPESGPYTVDDSLNIYAHHGTGHIEQIRRNLAAMEQAV
jgi:uncharacterized damage-inducible protein DinB